VTPRTVRENENEDEAQAQLDTAIDWGRYGELFDYRAGDGQLILTPADDMAA
jgi:NitT/TauT family transport system ATP-binding protein